MDYSEYSDNVRKRLDEKLRELKVSRKDLSDILNISQANVGNFLSGKSRLDLEKLYIICQHYSIPLGSLLIPEELEKITALSDESVSKKKTSLLNLYAITRESGLLYDPENPRIRKLLNKEDDPDDFYYFYTKPTNMDLADEFLSGKLKILKSLDAAEVAYTRVELTLFTGEKDPQTKKDGFKKYSGNLLMGDGTNVCFMLVASEDIEELNMIAFNYGILYRHRLESAFAVCNTVSSIYNRRRTTVEKAIITSYELSKENLQDLNVYISMNFTGLYIKDTELNNNPELKQYAGTDTYYRLGNGWEKELIKKDCIEWPQLETIPFLRISRDDDERLHQYIKQHIINDL